MMDSQQHGEQLKRGLKNRHIQLIALGGAIGTGLFLGSASVIQSAGPGIILGYAIAGFIAFLIMRQLGEMVVEEPVAGSFSHFAYKYWGGFAGFASGWNYWVLYVLVAMAELTAVGKYIQFWYPEIPTWASAAAFFVIINAINLTNVKVFGETSPFVLIFHELGDTFVANALNIVVLTAALSVYNSCVYCNSRMLFGLAQQGNAPKALLNVDKRGVPVSSILVSAVVTALCVLLNYLAPESAFGLLMALVVSALVINWAMISLAHMMFRRAKQQQGVKTRFPALFYPFGNVLCLLFMAAVLIIMLMTPGMAISVWLIPVWLLILGVGYLCKEKTAKTVKAH
ncbi:amino acid permease [Salmonella enterica subsp. enterica]|uniref:amino acid permease n=1 Tax=Salmonella enterica TaxID=28901 RepID=UPI001181DC20|nr:amino acid permease [Salmonella enterica]TRN47724.1 amino acid permease [Salmonella enterica subsp. enterica]